MEVISHFNMAESRPVLTPTRSPGLRERAATGPMKLDDDDDNRLAAISTGKTSCLPLIGLPKKKVDFNPTQSIIQPLSIDDELWCNLTAEITRRKSTSSDTCVESGIAPPSMPAPERAGRMVRLQRHFKKAMTRLRKVFHQSPDQIDSSNSVHSPSPAGAPSVPRILVRRDSNVSSAKRLAAKRKRTSVTDNELSETEWIRQFQSPKLSADCDEPESSQITSELLEIFEHLTVSVRKRPRLDSIEPFSCRIRTC